MGSNKRAMLMTWTMKDGQAACIFIRIVIFMPLACYRSYLLFSSLFFYFIVSFQDYQEQEAGLQS